MKNGITKEELAWMVTRVVGVIFLWLAVETGGKLLAIHFSSQWAGVSIPPEMAANASRALMFSLTIYCMLGMYLLRYGAFFVGLISREGGDGTQENAKPSKPYGPQGFQKWLAEDEGRKSFPYEQQLVMFEAWQLENL